MANKYWNAIYHICIRKKRYRSKVEAESALRQIRKRGDPQYKGMSAYHCRLCKGWHLGH